jgi:predicted ribosomally synthesized peptide with SipW-like signal peptide
MQDHGFELTRRRVLAGIGGIGAAAAGAGLGTSAYFSDTESFDGNTLTAGELDLLVHYDFAVDQGSASGNFDGPTSGTVQGNTDSEAGAEISYNLSDVKPGDQGSLEFCFSLVNNPAYLWMKGALTGESENGTTEPEGDSPWETDGGELATYTRASLYYTGETSDSNDEDVLITEGTLLGVLADLQRGLPLHGDGDPTAGVVDRPMFDGGDSTEEPTDPTCVRLDWHVPTWVGNEIQSDSLSFDLSFYAEQARNNDGTGDMTLVGTGDDLQTAIDDASAGDTLLLEAGTHTDEVTVDKSLDVRGEGPSNTTYDAHDVGGSGSLTSARDLGMKIRAGNVRVGDMTATGADQAIQFNDNSGSRLSGGMVSNAVVRDNGNQGRGRALVINHTDGALVRDTDILDNGNDGLTAWYTNDSHFETIRAAGNGDNGIYVNGDNNILLDSVVEENAEEGVDVSWKGDRTRTEQRVTLDNVVARNNGQSGNLPQGEGEDIELHDDDGDDSVAPDSVLFRKVDTSGSSAPLGLRLVNVEESQVRTEQCSFPNGQMDGNDNDVDP